MITTPHQPNSATPYAILGTGQLGLAIMETLVAQGQAVTLVNRSGKPPEPLPVGSTSAKPMPTMPPQ